MQSCLPSRFFRIAFARPELSGYKVSSKSAEQYHGYICNLHENENESFNPVLEKMLQTLHYLPKRRQSYFWFFAKRSSRSISLKPYTQNTQQSEKLKIA